MLTQLGNITFTEVLTSFRTAFFLNSSACFISLACLFWAFFLAANMAQGSTPVYHIKEKHNQMEFQLLGWYSITRVSNPSLY